MSPKDFIVFKRKEKKTYVKTSVVGTWDFFEENPN